jgi:hypothetical protein
LETAPPIPVFGFDDALRLLRQRPHLLLQLAQVRVLFQALLSTFTQLV